MTDYNLTDKEIAEYIDEAWTLHGHGRDMCVDAVRMCYGINVDENGKGTRDPDWVPYGHEHGTPSLYDPVTGRYGVS